MARLTCMERAEQFWAALGEYASASRSKKFEYLAIACACIGALERRAGPAATPEYLAAEDVERRR